MAYQPRTYPNLHNTPRPTPPRPDTPRPGTPYQFPPSTLPLDLSTEPFNNLRLDDILPEQLDHHPNPLLLSDNSNWSILPNPPLSPQTIDILEDEEGPEEEIFFSDLDLEDDNPEIQVVNTDDVNEVIEEEDSEVPGLETTEEDDLGPTFTAEVQDTNQVGPAEMLGRLLNCPEGQTELPHLHRWWDLTRLSGGNLVLKPTWLLSRPAQKNLLRHLSPTDILRHVILEQNSDIYLPQAGMFVDRVTGVPLPSLPAVNRAEGVTATIPLPLAAILGLPVFAAYPNKAQCLMLFKARLASLIYKLQEELELPEDPQMTNFVQTVTNQVKITTLTLIQ